MDCQDENKAGSANVGGKPFRIGFFTADGPLKIETERQRAAARRRYRRENVLHDQGHLYHYTSLVGFQGIIASRGFWASDTRFMNDVEEMRHGAELAASVLEHRRKRTRHEAFANVLDQVRRDILEPPTSGTLVACFSTARDSLEQWRAYGGAGGVCIGVGGFITPPDPNPLRAKAPLFYAPDMMPRRVLYGWKEKCASILSIVRRYETEYLKDREVMSAHWPINQDFEYKRYMLRAFQYSLVGFKNSAFSQEEEARVVISQEHASRFGELKFRPSSLGLIPYVCTGDKLEGPVGILSVTVGPSPHQELVATSLRTFLDHHGYEDVPLDLSKVPYRSS